MGAIERWLRRRSGTRNVKLATPLLERIRAAQQTLAGVSELRTWTGLDGDDLLVAVFASVAEAAWRVLGVRVFDTQLIAALAIHRSRVAEMQTGEGKTLAAVFPAVLHALTGEGVHIMTVNDYLARRDAQWMGGVYRLLGLSVAHVAQGMTIAERKAAYAADVTYGTANEIGFDYLRDHLRYDAADLVQRPFHSVIIDEADSILIDEARIPLVIAGGVSATDALPYRMAELARALQPGWDYTTDDYARNVHLTEPGARRAELWLACGNLYELENLPLLTALNHALHAKALLRRDVDYVVKDGAVKLVDEFKGRIAQDRRWPDGLHTAVEAKEGAGLKREGRVLGSITLQNLIDLYPEASGMTATASTQAEEFRRVYDLEVAIIPPNRPNIRVDYADVIFPRRAAKEAALLNEIREVHATGQPVLVGTGSVAESERISAALSAAGIPHEVLNARNDEQEARIVAQAGALGAVTISTNMAGRGTDILLGDGVAELGGLYVIGTNKHESRRIDDQLRGRAGRQGDPGSSIFFVSLEDDLVQRFGIHPVTGAEVYRAQRIIEGQHIEIRQRLWRYEGILEEQRRIIHFRRRAMLLERAPKPALARMDELWSDYLERITELREGIHWVSVAGKDPVHEFRKQAIELFDELLNEIENPGEATESGWLDTSATWTYLINDQPMGDLTQRFFRGFMARRASLAARSRRTLR